MAFASDYREYVKVSRREAGFGFHLRTLARLEPLLAFLYRDWWKVDFKGLEHLPEKGPALIVGNAGGPIPWPALMLIYALMSSPRPRRLSILADMDFVKDERLWCFLIELGFVPWSSDNAARLAAQGATVAIFPEGLAGMLKPFKERYRVRPFDWTRILPAVQHDLPLVPLATLDCDESFPVAANLQSLARFCELPGFPLTPTFPWLPFPTNCLPLPVSWKMRLGKPIGHHPFPCQDVHQTAIKQSLFLEGEVQAELNRLLRMRVKPLF